MTTARQIGIVTGLAVEAGCLRKAAARIEPPIIFVAGASAERARAGALRLAENGAAGLLSFGLAGGLDPAVRPGTVIIARAIAAADRTLYTTDKPWRTRLLAEAGDRVWIREGVIAGRGEPVRSVADKKALFAATQAAAVDMESHAVAAVARQFSLPFLAVRAVADPARRKIPAAALAGLAPDGTVRPDAVIAALLARPWEIFGLIGLAAETRAAMRSLRRVADLGALLSLPG